MASRYDINANLLFKWKREAEAGELGGSSATAKVAEHLGAAGARAAPASGGDLTTL